jgi:hypothetical protein
MKAILVAIMMVILSGCATQAPNVVLSTKQYPIDVGKVSVSNLSVPNERNEGGAWTSGLIKLADSNTNPTLSKYVFESLNQNLTPSSTSGSGVLEVMLLRADLLMEVRVADSIAFIAFATVLSERDYVCSVEMNFKYGVTNERKKFESKKVFNRGWNDIDTEAKKEIIESCVESIVHDSASYANSFVKK